MPNGQLVEYYFSFKELIDVKDAEKIRGLDGKQVALYTKAMSKAHDSWAEVYDPSKIASGYDSLIDSGVISSPYDISSRDLISTAPIVEGPDPGGSGNSSKKTEPSGNIAKSPSLDQNLVPGGKGLSDSLFTTKIIDENAEKPIIDPNQGVIDTFNRHSAALEKFNEIKRNRSHPHRA